MSHKTRFSFPMLMMLSLLFPVKGFTDTYKWTDKNGTLHFSDNPTDARRGSGMSKTQEDTDSSPSDGAQSATTEDNKPAKQQKKRTSKNRKPHKNDADESSQPADISTCLNTFYSMVTTELNKAYVNQGRPQVNFDNMVKIKDLALTRLEANVGQWPKKATFSISVLDDYISVYVYCGTEQNIGGQWRP